MGQAARQTDGAGPNDFPGAPFHDPDVRAAFERFTASARRTLLEVRGLIFSIAAETPGAGRIEEALRWGQPAYLTPETRSGSTLRLGVPGPGLVAIYTHCRTSLMADFRAAWPEFAFDGNRAVHLPDDAVVPTVPITALIRAALTYHRRFSSAQNP